MSIAFADQTIAAFIREAFPLEGGAEPPAAPSVTDWECILQSAEKNAVAPLLYAALKKSGRETEIPANAFERLRVAYLRSDTANWLALQELRSLLVEFERAQISLVVLKGGALATTLYPEPALRPMSDLDILIPHVDYARANALLIERGYASPVEMGESFGAQLTNYRAYDRRGSSPAHLELHWHLFKSPYYCQRVPIEWFWDRTTEIAVHNQRVRVFERQAQFLHLAAHFALHHRAERLIWSYDLALLLARERARINWDDVLDAAERFGLIPPLQLAAARVSATWGVSMPPDVSARMTEFPSKWQDRAAFAMMTARRGEARFLLDAFSQPNGSLSARFWLYHLFPSREYMQERYCIRDERWLPFFYVRRLFEGPWKFLRSLISTVTQH